jgi:hypothetical protein
LYLNIYRNTDVERKILNGIEGKIKSKEVRQMSSVEIYDMRDKNDEYFVGTCTHVNGISEHMLREEINTFAKRQTCTKKAHG